MLSEVEQPAKLATAPIKVIPLVEMLIGIIQGRYNIKSFVHKIF